MTRLQPIARIPTSGARCVEHWRVDGRDMLAVAQLAVDVPGRPADMNGGDSDLADVRLLRRREGSPPGDYRPDGALAVPGGEDVEVFTVDGRTFLAVAGIRAGRGPYDFARPQPLFEWDGEQFVPLQAVDGYAAKQWRHIRVGDRHFLGLAQGVALPGHPDSRPSCLYAWDGERFVHAQDVDSAWGYNWHPFTLDGGHFLAYADHARPSTLLRWNGTAFEHHQDLVETGGRAFATFERDGATFLAVARLGDRSEVLRWDGDRFVPHQHLDGTAGREFALIHAGDDLYVLRVDFITGTPADPVTTQRSPLLHWHDGRLHVVEHLATTGATDATAWHEDGRTLVAVSNSLDASVRFAAHTCIYEFRIQEQR